jgi:hypothetical protein
MDLLETTTPAIPESQRSMLLQAPLFDPQILTIGDGGEVAVLLRVDDLKPYRRGKLSLRCKFVTWQNMFGTWVVCIALNVVDQRKNPQENSLELAAYLNPRHATDWDMFKRVSTQHRLAVTFFDRKVTDAVTRRISWTVTQRHEIWRAIEQIGKDLLGERRLVNFDPSFDLARIAFEHRFSTREIFG